MNASAVPAAVALSVVIPVYNEQAALADSVSTLEHYLRNDFPFSWRITIADNASTDRTWEIASTLAATIDGVQERWVAGYQKACRSRSSRVFPERIRCLEGLRDQASGVIAMLAQAPPPVFDRFDPAIVRADRLIRLAGELRVPDGKHLVLCPARLGENNGQKILIEALRLLDRDEPSWSQLD